MKLNKQAISSKDISVIIQGDIRAEIHKCLKSIRKHLPQAEIIISTWQECDTTGLDCDIIVKNVDPGAPSGLPANWKPNNTNRQIISTINGIKRASRPYVLKIRSDFYLKSKKILEIFCSNYVNNLIRDNQYSFTQKRILIPNYFTRHPRKERWNFCFHPSDLWLFGTKEDIEDYFNIPIMDKYCVKKNKKTLHYRFGEQHIFIEFLKKHGFNVAMETAFDNNIYLQDETIKALLNNFFIVDDTCSGIKLASKFYQPNLDENKYYTMSTYEYFCLYREFYKNSEKIPKIFLQNALGYYTNNIEYNAHKQNIKPNPSSSIKDKNMYAIITPTYIEHFKYIKNYLKSFVKFVTDKENISLYFVISLAEKNKFEKIIFPYKKKCNITVLYIEELLKSFGVNETPSMLLKKYGRFSFQTFKKMYALLSIPEEKSLILDCESMWINKTDMSKLFQDFFSNPTIYKSKLEKKYRTKDGFNQMVKNIDILLDTKCTHWVLENFMWFYEKRIVKELVANHGHPIEMANKLISQNNRLKLKEHVKYGIFEIVLYLNYILKNNAKYQYTIKSADNLLSKYLPQNEKKAYLDSFYARFKGNCGILEHAMLFLNKNNWKHLAHLFKEEKFNIIRCEESDRANYYYQKKFLRRVQPNILAASQEHLFGVNATIFNRCKIIFRNSKYIIKIKKHWDYFFAPINIILKPFKILFKFINKFLVWLTQPIAFILYVLKLFIELLKNLRLILLG